MLSPLVTLLLLMLLNESTSSREVEEEGDVPPAPKHDGSHMIKKFSLGKKIKDLKLRSKQNIWELSGLFEGDIMDDSGMLEVSTRNGVRDKRAYWPRGEVPYHIMFGIEQKHIKILKAAMDEYHQKSCIRFRPYRKGDSDFVQIRNDGGGCWSYVGKLNGGQVVNLGNNCMYHGAVVHELLHTLGFHHQQSASNRDDYVKIEWENMKPKFKGNFQKLNESKVTDFGVPYDYHSIMHYSSYAFTKNGERTIIPLVPGVKLGNNKMSPSDILKLNLMYNCGNYSTSTT